MASSKLFLGSLLFILLTVHVVECHKQFEKTVERNLVKETASATGIDCEASCEVRCSKSSRPNLCKRACGTCCSRCSCVPPGTYGNYDACPCYASQTTRGGVPKCP